MQLHQLQPKHKPKDRKRVGRGGKKGASSGLGVKKLGSSQPRIREILKRYPKLRGYRFTRRRGAQAVVNLEVLEKNFSAGQNITPSALIAKRIIRRIRGKDPEVKILGEGNLTKAFTIENCKVSAGAKKKIEALGGEIL